jgi:AcrR family transcriptional regulator
MYTWCRKQLGVKNGRVPVVEEQLGLRERKRLRTHRTISETAIALFMERGYDNVSIAEIAEAAEVSRRTLFAYFPTKDDLVLHRVADHEDEPARIVRGREPGEAPLDALERQHRTALENRDPITGLCDLPPIVAFYQLIWETPALVSALVSFTSRAKRALATALREAAPEQDETVARLAAAQIVGVRSTLADTNQQRIIAGETADALVSRALAESRQAHDMLRGGLRPYR